MEHIGLKGKDSLNIRNQEVRRSLTTLVNNPQHLEMERRGSNLKNLDYGCQFKQSSRQCQKWKTFLNLKHSSYSESMNVTKKNQARITTETLLLHLVETQVQLHSLVPPRPINQVEENI